MAVFFVSCEKDEISGSVNEQQNEKFRTEIIYGKEIRQNRKIAEKIDLLSMQMAGRGIDGDTIGIEIDTTRATYIESSDKTYHSYTFRITNGPEENPYRNLVFSLAPKGGYYAYLAVFDLAPGDAELVEAGKAVPNIMQKTVFYPVELLSGNTQVAGRDSGCIPMFTTIIPGHDCTAGGHHSYGEPCAAEPGSDEAATPTQIIFTLNDCGSTGNPYSTVPIPTNPSGPPPGNWGTPGSGTVVGPGPIPEPTSIPYEQNLMACISVPMDVEAWLMDPANFVLMRPLSSFVTDDEGNCIPENLPFAEQAAEALASDGQVDYVNEVILDPTFLNNQKANCVYEKKRLVQYDF